MTKRGRKQRIACVGLLLAGATAGAVPASAVARDGAAGKAAATLLFPSLFNVAATSAGNAWAVGQYQSGSVNRTLIVHWNGKTWQRVPSPNPAAAGDTLSGVAVTSLTNAWASGEQNGHSLLLRWNGKAWRQVKSPDIGNLASVAAASAHNAWAVGIGGSSGTQIGIEHWNGTAWKVVPSPVRVGQLAAVAVNSATDAWAVGFRGTFSASQMLAEHWNGKAWQVVHSPDPAGAGVLLGVAIAPAGAAWAVSGAAGKPLDSLISVINHWNGKAWARVKSPNPEGGASFNGVAVTSSKNAWAVGEDLFFVNGPRNEIAHWNGKAWKLVSGPIADGELFGVTAIPSGNVWAVGSNADGAIVEHWNGTGWTSAVIG